MALFRSYFQAFSRGFQLIRMGTMNTGSMFYPSIRNIHCMGKPLNFYITPALSAEPLKKRKRIDPAIIRERAEKKVKRIQRDIRRLEKVAKKFKPLAELEVPKKILKEKNPLRPALALSEEEIQRRADLEKQWGQYKNKQHYKEIQMINKVIASQEKAMDALKEASSELYEQALQVDPTFIPLHMTGPTRTPPVEDFDYPDGSFIDVTKKYLPIVPVETKQKKGRINSTKK